MTKKLSKYNSIIIILATIVLILITFIIYSFLINKKSRTSVLSKITSKNCIADECILLKDVNYPTSTLNEDIKQTLFSALDDEYKAYSTYNTVIRKFGNIRPFIMIIRAEEQHISSLKSLFDKYGIDIPENKYNNIEAPSSITDSCKLGVSAEINNAKLYREKLIPLVKDYEDITIVFTNLMNASQLKHLPAFEKCTN